MQWSVLPRPVPFPRMLESMEVQPAANIALAVAKEPDRCTVLKSSPKMSESPRWNGVESLHGNPSG